MILTELGPLTAYRMHTPRWATAPTASKLAPGGLNLVIYNDMLVAEDTLQVYDPTGALPKNQDSWRQSAYFVGPAKLKSGRRESRCRHRPSPQPSPPSTGERGSHASH